MCAKSTSQIGGQYIRRFREQNISRKQTMVDTIRAAALRWSYARFDCLYSLRDRVQQGWIAVLQNAETISCAHSPLAMAYTIVDRTLNRLYSEEFSAGRPRQQQFANNGEEEIRTIEFGATGSSFERPPSPNAISQMYSDVRKLDFDTEFQRLLKKLPTAMSRLDPIEGEVIRLYYGFANELLTIRQVARIIERPLSTTYEIKEAAIRKLRVALGILRRRRRRRK